MSMNHARRNLGVAVALGALLGAAGVAAGQPGAPPPPPPPGGAGGYGPPPPQPTYGVVDRHGFMAGFSIGAGSMVPDCDGCDSESGIAVDGHLGGMLSPRFALMWDGSVVAHTEDNLTLFSTVNAVAAQYWATPKVWIKGGLGFGRLSISDDTGDTLAESDTAASVLGAAGVEVMQSRTFALDISLRFAVTAYEDANLTNVALNVGFNWF
jgi:hypothetical protein